MRGRAAAESKKKTLVDSHWCSEPGIVPRRVASEASAEGAVARRATSEGRTVEVRMAGGRCARSRVRERESSVQSQRWRAQQRGVQHDQHTSQGQRGSGALPRHAKHKSRRRACGPGWTLFPLISVAAMNVEIILQRAQFGAVAPLKPLVTVHLEDLALHRSP